MPNIINGNRRAAVLTTARGVRVPLYKNDRLNPDYVKKFTSPVNAFMKHAKNANASRRDIINLLERKNFINDYVREDAEFQAFINSRIEADRIGLEPNEMERCINYLLNHIRTDPKYTNRRLTQNDILGDLKDAGKLRPRPRLTNALKDVMKGVMSHHNRAYTLERMQRYETGKHMYWLWCNVKVFNESHDPQTYIERTNLKFRSDLPKDRITKEMAEELVQIYYAKRDYPDFVDLVKFDPPHLLDPTEHDLMKMHLFDVICGKLYKIGYIQQLADLIEGFDPEDPQFKDKCCRTMLQLEYKGLVDRRQIKKETLTNEYMDKFFTNPETGVAEYTVERVIEFVKHLKYASIYIYDQIGKVLIASHSAREESEEGSVKINAHVSTNSIVCLLGQSPHPADHGRQREEIRSQWRQAPDLQHPQSSKMAQGRME